jgi:hypothetical protein
MKPQDIVFIIVFLMLLWKRRDSWFTIAGLILLGLAIPLYASWTFFTAQRFVIYGAVLLTVSIIMQLQKKDKVQ